MLVTNNILGKITISRCVFALAVALHYCNLNAQIANYVNNGGFENLISGTVTSYYNAAEYWQPIDSGKFSYYLYSKSPQIGSAPYCFQGYQQPRSGNNFIAPTFYCINCPYNNSRSYPRNRLKQNLIAGKVYCSKYYIVNTNNSPLAIDSYGIYFADATLDTIKYCTQPLNYLNAQIQSSSGIIIDTVTWIPIAGTFTAIGTEKYMVLGNFRSNAATNTLLINPTYSATLVNDIYIDDASLIEMDLPAYTGPDKAMKPGDSVYIGRPSDVGIDESCMWYKLPTVITSTTPALDTVAGLWVKPVVTTTYVVKQQLWCSGIKWDTVVVYLNLVGIEKLKMLNEELKVYPVPAKDYFELSISNENLVRDFTSLSIFNNLGLLVRKEEVSFKDKSLKINTSDLAEGVYLITLNNSKNEKVIKKLIIAK